MLALSAFFSIAETSMMAINRYKLKHLVAQEHGGAKRVAALLQRTDRLPGGSNRRDVVDDVRGAGQCHLSGSHSHAFQPEHVNVYARKCSRHDH